MNKNVSQVWNLPVRDLMHRPGEMRTHSLEFPNPEKLGEGVIDVPEGQPLQLEVRLESVYEGVLASGTVESEAIGECVRCLNEVRLPIAVNFQELFAYEQGEGIEYLVQDDHVNLEPIVRDAVVLALPFSPVCEGGCDRPVLAEGISIVLAEDEVEPARDPRWDKLSELLERPEDE